MISYCNIGYNGRLGNQMFQLAATVGIAKKLGLEARFPIENCTNAYQNGPIDAKTNSQMFVKCDILECFDIPDSYFVDRSEIKADHIYNENTFEFNADAFKIHQNTTLNGYFQSEKYFIDYRKEILDTLKFKYEIIQKSKKYIDKIRDINKGRSVVSIHVRRGDYLMYPDYHPVCSDEYYNLAINEFADADPLYVVFSDDPEWCKSVFTSDIFIVSDLCNQYEEMCAMSMCDHHIIANSSFSWWAAWLNNSEAKKVVAPSQWFGKMLNKTTSDVYCKGWIKK